MIKHRALQEALQDLFLALSAPLAGVPGSRSRLGEAALLVLCGLQQQQQR